MSSTPTLKPTKLRDKPITLADVGFSDVQMPSTSSPPLDFSSFSSPLNADAAYREDDAVKPTKDKKERKWIIVDGKRLPAERKCAKCGVRKSILDFGTSADAPYGRQTYCKVCKNALGKKRRQMNMAARLKHHMATRVSDQLGELMPKGFSKEMEKYLGYNLGTLVRLLKEDLHKREPGKKLRTAIEDEGYHVDHLYPLSRFKVVVDGEVDWDEFKRCWHPSNLSAIPAAENLAKGAKVDDGS